MMRPPTYGNLFAFLDAHIPQRESGDPFQLVRDFSDIHCLDADALISTLAEFGGYDDLEVLFNVVSRIPEGIVIGSQIETPEEFAIRNGLYGRRKDGQWTACSADEPDAVPDLNRAVAFIGKR
jgi:hypothetical protein